MADWKNLMQRSWLRHYPPGVAAEIDPARYPSLVAMFEESFRSYATRTACICMGKGLTYSELDDTSRAFAAWVQNIGLSRGARVGIMLPNVLQYPVAIIAILRAGYTVVNINPLYKPRELEWQLNDSGAEAVIVLENFAAALQEALPLTSVNEDLLAGRKLAPAEEDFHAAGGLLRWDG
jgi:long-chain acyl-CoA synthetase